jgi:chloramphenicol-sensitive protein RarD
VDRPGLVFGIVAYVWWGLMPLYFREVQTVPAWELLAHRVVWSAVLLAGFLTAMRRWPEVARCLRSPATFGLLLVTTLLLAANWLGYIYAATTDQLVQASLGYFILPLVSVVLAMVFLGERLRGGQGIAVLLAAAGVVNLVARGDDVPWLALTLAISFSFYGLLRKKVGVDGLVGLSVETLLLAPFAAGYLLVLGGDGKMGTEGVGLDVLLVLSGVVTTVPLFCFGEAARRLPLLTLSFMQYLSPTLQLLLAVFRNGEPFGPEKQLSFALIWVALLLYMLVALRAAPEPPT